MYEILKYKYVCYYFSQCLIIIDGMRILSEDFANFQKSFAHHSSHTLKISGDIRGLWVKWLLVCSPDSPPLNYLLKIPLKR